MNFDVSKAMTVKLSSDLPPKPLFESQYRRAPNRGYDLNPAETVVAVKNALRYVPENLHETLAPEFLNELMTRGRIYGYRYRPAGVIRAKPVEEYKGILEARAMQLMIDNNLNFITDGGASDNVIEYNSGWGLLVEDCPSFTEFTNMFDTNTLGDMSIG